MTYIHTSENNTLDLILQDKASELLQLKKSESLESLKVRSKEKRTIRDFKTALENPNKISLIAEIKKASPSAGDINTEVDITKQAQIYETSGASAVSVLTDSHFKGELAFLEKIKAVTTIPVLRKDFIFDPYQVYESYVAGADAILLITSILDVDTLKELLALAHELGMECLVETHTKEDIEKALQTDATIIGINARNLKTFEVSLENTAVLAKGVPKNRILIAESGVETKEDVQRMKESGARSILVGTTLMKAVNVEEKVKELCIEL